MPKTEMTNMCMVCDPDTNRVLVQDRVWTWKGISFPGGHVDDGEGVVDSVIREVKEETGLDVRDLEMCGVVHWFNDETGDRYLVFNYRTSSWSGELLESTEEGRVFWVDKDDLPNLNLSPGMLERLPMFLGDGYLEAFGIWNAKGRSDLTLR